jgi:hypothetical protein
MHLAIHQTNTAGCGSFDGVTGRIGMAVGGNTRGTRGAVPSVEVLNMKKYLLLPLIALGLVAWVPNQAKAGVHVTFGIGAPAYYGPYYGSYYYPGYAYYYHPYWHHRHYYYDRHR